MQSTTMRMTSVTSRVLVAVTAVALTLAAGCSSGSNTGATPNQQNQPSPANPVTTSDSDCEQNATLVTIDESTWGAIGSNPVGEDPDVLAYDAAAHRLYVAAESGTLTTLDLQGHKVVVSGSAHLAGGTHVVAVDPATHRSFYPIPAGTNGRPALPEREPT